MELRQIESFVAVAEELHFGRAARRIHLSQPALSQQIKRLEAELGFELLTRTQRSVELTPAGTAFLDNARQLLADADRMVVEASLAAAGRTGTLRLGYVGSALFSVVPPIVRALRSRAPGIELSLVEMKSELQFDEMRAERMDAGFVKAPAADVAGFAVRPVHREGIGLAVASGHHLSGADAIALAEVADEPFVIFPRAAEPDTFDLLMRFCADHGFVPTIAQEALSLQTVLGLVATGLGIAFVADSVMESSARSGVTYVRLEPPTPLLTTALARPSDTTNPAVALLEEITAGTVAPIA
ncbi:MAG: LysR substrate-binding domain-containing protein [Actinomycetota bacterium]|nr:LysR substrate-binding domain-containing protein [Actinomycetota bacterium]